MSMIASTVAKTARKRMKSLSTFTKRARRNGPFRGQLGAQLSGQLRKQSKRIFGRGLGKGVLRMQGKPLKKVKQVRRKATRAVRGRR